MRVMIFCLTPERRVAADAQGWGSDAGPDSPRGNRVPPEPSPRGGPVVPTPSHWLSFGVECHRAIETDQAQLLGHKGRQDRPHGPGINQGLGIDVMHLCRLQVAQLRQYRFPRLGQPHLYLHLSHGVVSFSCRTSPGAPGSLSGAALLTLIIMEGDRGVNLGHLIPKPLNASRLAVRG